MAFTARAVAAATAPWPLVVGTRTFWARPLSAALVVRLLPDLGIAVTRPRAMQEAYRAAFAPVRQAWWERLLRGRVDPVRAVSQMEEGLQGAVLRALFAVPGQTPDEELDPEAAMVAAHRKFANPTSTGRTPTLVLAILTCEAHLGGSWFYDPNRWPTADGFAPLATVWTTYHGLLAIDAKRCLDLASAVRLGMADGRDANVKTSWQKLEAAAFPPDRTLHLVN